MRTFRWCPILALSAAHAAFAAEPAQDAAVTLDAGYTAEVWRNVRGGLRRDGAYLDNLQIGLSVDGAQALGTPGMTLHLSGLYNNRSTFSETIVGDLQTVSNIDTDGSARLYEAWIEATRGLLSVKLGAIDLNSEFDVNETGGLFINSSHGIGPDFSQTGENGPSIFPIVGLGARLGVDLGGGWSVKAAAFEGTPGDRDRPRRTVFKLHDGEGALLVGEVRRELPQGTRFVFGAWHHTQRFDDVFRRDAAGEPLRGREAAGVYALAEGRLASWGERELRGFVRVGQADGDVHQIGAYYGAGLTLGGPMLTAGADEAIGVAVAIAAIGDPYRRAARRAGVDADAGEAAVEFTYHIPLAGWLSVQPDVQYIINPGADPSLRDAIAVGLRTVISWQGAF